MKVVHWFELTCAGLLVAASGCSRITTQVVEKPRVDQELEGNRGYLAGSALSAGPRRQTRQMVETNIELPTASELIPWKIRKESPPSAAPVKTTSVSPAEPYEPVVSQAWEEPIQPIESAPIVEEAATSTTYTVKKGDTLEKIAARLYGNSNEWRRIYKANQDKLAGPNRIYPGQVLTIPEAGEADSSRRADSPYK